MGVAFETGDDLVAMLTTFAHDHGSPVADKVVGEQYRRATLGEIDEGELWGALGLDGDPAELTDTFLVGHRLTPGLRPFLERKGRMFLVVPRIDGPGGLHAHARVLLDGPWKGLSCACVHGRMPGEEVEAAVESFRRGDARVLLGTTVVEVGLDLADVPAMVVLDAQRLGLASLHQLRGRLARGPGAAEADCWFLGEEESLERLRVLERCTDGFAVAEADLRERGPGALRGTRQHGRSDFQVFDPVRDADLVETLRVPAVAAFLDAACQGSGIRGPDGG